MWAWKHVCLLHISHSFTARGKPCPYLKYCLPLSAFLWVSFVMISGCVESWACTVSEILISDESCNLLPFAAWSIVGKWPHSSSAVIVMGWEPRCQISNPYMLCIHSVNPLTLSLVIVFVLLLFECFRLTTFLMWGISANYWGTVQHSVI